MTWISALNDVVVRIQVSIQREPRLHPIRLSLKTIIPLILASILCLQASAHANECLQLQKQQAASYPYFSFIHIDHEAFDDISQINQHIKRLKDENEIIPEYWAGDLTHFIQHRWEKAEGFVKLVTEFHEGEDDAFFIERSYVKKTPDHLYTILQSFKVDTECKKKLVNTRKLPINLKGDRIVETSFIDGELEVETANVGVTPKEFGLFETAQILEAQGNQKLTAFLVMQIPYVDVTISDSYSEETIQDIIVQRDVIAIRKHLLYEIEKIGNIDISVYKSPLSFYKKITLKGLGLQDKTVEHVTREIWMTSPLSRLITAVNFDTKLKRVKGSKSLESYKILSNLPIEHDNLPNYPYLKALGREGDKYAYQLLADIEYKPVKSVEKDPDTYLQSTYYINPTSPKLLEFIQLIDTADPQEMLDDILLIANHFILTYDHAQAENGNTRLMTTEQIINKGKGVCQHYANLVVALCRAKGIPARIIGGYLVGENSYSHHAWIEAYVNNIWMPISPQSSLLDQSRLSNRYIPVLVWNAYESMSNTNTFESSFRFAKYQCTVTEL